VSLSVGKARRAARQLTSLGEAVSGAVDND
jgi:hypothetical protein